MSGAMLGYSTKFEIATSGLSPADFVQVGEVTDIKPPSATRDQIDVTHMQSPNRRREFIPGLTDGGECSFDMNYIPGSEGDDELWEILDLPPGADQTRTCRITYPNGVTHTFDAILLQYEPTVPTDDKMSAAVSFKVSGDVVRGMASP